MTEDRYQHEVGDLVARDPSTRPDVDAIIERWRQTTDPQPAARVDCDCPLPNDPDGSGCLSWAVYKTRCRACGANAVDVAPQCANREALECSQCHAQDSHTRLIPADLPLAFRGAIPYPVPEDDV